MTALQFLNEYYRDKCPSHKDDVAIMMIEFAKMHAKAFRESIFNKYGHDTHLMLSQDDIKNSYPLENIK